VMNPKWIHESHQSKRHEPAKSQVNSTEDIYASSSTSSSAPSLDQGNDADSKQSSSHQGGLATLDQPPVIARISKQQTDDIISEPTEAFTSRIASVYHDCLLQDVTDYRQEYQCLRASEIVERMRLGEKRAARLHERGLAIKRSRLWAEIDAL
jgi:hypothetical protein